VYNTSYREASDKLQVVLMMVTMIHTQGSPIYVSLFFFLIFSGILRPLVVLSMYLHQWRVPNSNEIYVTNNMAAI